MSALNTQVGGDHYKDFAIQPIEFSMKNNLGFIEGDIVKRICRYKKTGTGLQDLNKIIHEVELLKEMIFGSKGIPEEPLYRNDSLPAEESKTLWEWLTADLQKGKKEIMFSFIKELPKEEGYNEVKKQIEEKIVSSFITDLLFLLDTRVEWGIKELYLIISSLKKSKY